MFGTFWFLIKTIITALLILWIIGLDGSVSISYIDYTISSGLGAFILLCLFLYWILSVVVRAIYLIIRTPHHFSVYQEKRSYIKGMKALSYGLSAVAAKDLKSARYYSKRATRFLVHDFGLSDFLAGLTAKMEGDLKGASQNFQKLSDQKETSFLGLKALLQIAVDKNDTRYARVLAERTYKKYPKQKWIIATLYRLYLKEREYELALSLLPQLRQSEASSPHILKNEEAVLYMLTGHLKKAYRMCQTSLPVGLRILEKYAQENKRRSSLKVIERLWGDNPHPKVMDYWIKYAPKKTQDNRPALIAWIEKLYHINPDNAASAFICGEAIHRLGQDDQAARFVHKAMALKPTFATYQLRHNMDRLGGWMNNMEEAIQDQAWVCSQTGKIYDEWKPMNDYDDFNTIQWAYPDDLRRDKVFDNKESLSLLG